MLVNSNTNRREALIVSVPNRIGSPMLSASMVTTSARLYLMEHVDPSGPSEGLHDQREFGVKSPSWNINMKSNC